MNPNQTAEPPADAVAVPYDEVIVQPGDERWDQVRAAWNLTVDQRPAAVALPRNAGDVIGIVQWARSRHLRVTAQSTGHAAAAYASLDDTVLIKTTGLDAVQVDAQRRRARVGAGVLWDELTAAAAEFGLAGLAGSGPDVGVVGYTLGGGISWLARRYGLAANSVLAVELVTADGVLVRADRSHHADLFWAVRGGGGAFGVVTALEIELYPVTTVYAGTLFWPMDQAERVLAAWRTWAEKSSVDVTSCARLLNLPPLPDIPEPLRGRSHVAVEVVHLGDTSAAEADLQALRDLAPALDDVATIPAAALGRLHMDPDHPVPGAGNGAMLDALPEEAIAALVAVAGEGTGSPLLSVEIRHLGGAVGEVAAGSGALAAIDAPFGLYAVGIAVTPELKGAIDRRIDTLGHALAPWTAEIGYLNFGDRPGDAEGFFTPETYRRLREVKGVYDPSDVFRSNHPIVPASRADA